MIENTSELEIEIVRKLLRLEMAGERTAIEIGPYSLFLLVSASQYTARRFPAGDVRGDALRTVAAQFDEYFEGTSAGEFIESEWKETDRAREARKRRKDGK